MTKYTPLPWMRNGQTVQGWWRLDGSSERVGLEFMENPLAIVPNEEDADFIVRACNAHDDLLVALKRLAPEGGDVRLTNRCRFCGEREPGKHTQDCAWVQGRDAIKKAEVQP